jgi:iron-sulfur cluster repair protein YtfE (RIC family)
MNQSEEVRLRKRYTTIYKREEFSTETSLLIELLKESFLDTELDPSLFSQVSNETLVTYLQKTHRYYLDVLIPEIEQNFIELIKVGSGYTVPLIKIMDEFIMVHKELKSHILEEEVMFVAFLNGENIKADHTECDHLERLQNIQHLLNYLDRSSQGLSIYSVINQKIEWFCKDLVLHEKIETELLK